MEELSNHAQENVTGDLGRGQEQVRGADLWLCLHRDPLGPRRGGRVLGRRQQGSAALRAEPAGHGRCNGRIGETERLGSPSLIQPWLYLTFSPSSSLPLQRTRGTLFVKSQPGGGGPWLPPGISHTPDRPKSLLHGGCAGSGRLDFSGGLQQVPR